LVKRKKTFIDGATMTTEELPPEETWRAIEIYLSHAYPGPPPAAVYVKVERLKLLPPESLYSDSAFERDSASPPNKLSLRLGNRYYPHMKLTIERAPDKLSFLFKADTHDSHCCPSPDSREHAAFRQLMDANQKIAQAIETAWAEQRLPTFKTFLRDDLARRAKTAGPVSTNLE
jgi:hypothetical protein